MNQQEKEELEEALLKKEKSFIEKIGGGTVVTLIVLTISLISTISVGLDKIDTLQKEVVDLKADKETTGKLLIEVQTEIKAVNSSIGDLKEQNKETYRLLLDFSKRQ